MAFAGLKNVTAIARSREDRLTFMLSVFTVILSGVAVMAVHNSTANLQRKRADQLTKGLWKFVPESAVAEAMRQRQWQWRILALSGVMLSATVVAMTTMRLGHVASLAIGGGIFALWLTVIFVFWHAWVITPDQNAAPAGKSAAAPASTATPSPTPAPDQGWQRKVKDDAGKDDRLPVTIITGFLGSGKTTLVKRILNNTVGMRVLVIENEIGSEGVDHTLLMQHTAKEEIVLMNNGCVCCTVRQDLLKTFHRMFENEAFSKLDWVVIETTGLADPAPLIQSLYIDEKCKARLRLDGVVTVVDCLHFLNHVEKAPAAAAAAASPAPNTSGKVGAHGGLSEARLQVAFADRVLLNKADLVATEHQAADPASGSSSAPGVVTLSAVAASVRAINRHATVIVCQHSAVPVEQLLNIRAFDASRNEEQLRALRQESGYELGGDQRPILVQRDGAGKIIPKAVRLNFGAGSADKSSSSSHAGGGIATLSLTSDEPLNLELFNEWIADVLRDHGENLYRLKGILSMAGFDEQFVAQGVHMIFDGERGPLWAQGSKRTSTLVLIGLKLPVANLQRGWLACRSGGGGGGGDKK